MNNGIGFTDLADVQTSTEKLPLVGYTVFWRLAGVRVSHDDLGNALDLAGFPDHLPKPPTPRVALRRALEQWLADQGRPGAALRPDTRFAAEQQDEEGKAERTLIRVINSAGGEHLVYALVAENVDFAALGLSYGTALRIRLHKKTGEMVCTTEASGEIDARRESRQFADSLAPYWGEFQRLFIARDLSQMMREIVGGLNATSLRRAGGVYFVPVTEREPLARLREMLGRLPRAPQVEPYLCALGIPRAGEAKKGLAQAVHAGVMDEIGLLRADLSRLAESEGKVREKTVTERLLGYRRLKAKAGIYQDLLDLQLEEVRAAVGDLEAGARRLLALGRDDEDLCAGPNVSAPPPAAYY